nr:hypothetical protein [Tanacetum cinerariifolium]
PSISPLSVNADKPSAVSAARVNAANSSAVSAARVNAARLSAVSAARINAVMPSAELMFSITIPRRFGGPKLLSYIVFSGQPVHQ